MPKPESYKGIIEAWLAAFPRLSAQRLFGEVRAARYEGSYGRVRDHVRSARPRQPVAAAVRFETPPGRQGQVDFGTFTLPWGRRHADRIERGPRARWSVRSAICGRASSTVVSSRCDGGIVGFLVDWHGPVYASQTERWYKRPRDLPARYRITRRFAREIRGARWACERPSPGKLRGNR